MESWSVEIILQFLIRRERPLALGPHNRTLHVHPIPLHHRNYFPKIDRRANICVVDLVTIEDDRAFLHNTIALLGRMALDESRGGESAFPRGCVADFGLI